METSLCALALTQLGDVSACRAKGAGPALGGESCQQPFDSAGACPTTGTGIRQLPDFLARVCPTGVNSHPDGRGFYLEATAYDRILLPGSSFCLLYDLVH